MNKYLTGQCSEEEFIEVNAWMKESEENARQLFRMEDRLYNCVCASRYRRCPSLVSETEPLVS